VNKLTKKFLNSFRAGESGFTLIELLIVIAILGILAAVIIPNVSKFIGTSHVAAANSELAQVQTAAQAAAADQANGVFTTSEAPAHGGFLLDNALMIATGTTVGTSAGDAADFAQYITGKLVGEYWIFDNGTVMVAANGTGTSAYSKLSTFTAGDPWYAGVYFNESTNQFQSTVPAAGNTAIGTSGATPGNQPSKN
jgi:type IV pilus assembly protein PilA